MDASELESGKRWSEETIRSLGHEMNVLVEVEWGAFWSRFGKSPQARRRASLQLILSRGRARKIVWLDAEDLQKAVTATDPPTARERIRSQVEAGITDIVRRLSLQ
jgi:hypothetical protein